MKLPNWTNPHRKRRNDINYNDKDFCKYYDVDLKDFEELVKKLQTGQRLSDDENTRFGMYILAMCYIVIDGPKFKNKPSNEREEIIEQQYMELLPGILLFNPEKGKIYSYSYRIAYTAACHYYTNKTEQYRRQKCIDEHCQEEYDYYLEEYSSHKKGIPHGRE